MNLTSGVTAISCGGIYNDGYFSSLAVKHGGVYAWGNNGTSQPNTPAPVTGLSSGVTSISSAGGSYLAIQNGGVHAWGDNTFGQLGDGTTTNRPLPIAIATLTGGVTFIASDTGSSFAIKNGAVYAWGGNPAGNLGDGTTIDHATPEQIDPTYLQNIVAIASGDGSTLRTFLRWQPLGVGLQQLRLHGPGKRPAAVPHAPTPASAGRLCL